MSCWRHFSSTQSHLATSRARDLLGRETCLMAPQAASTQAHGPSISKSVLLLVGLNGVDPQTLRATKGGTQEPKGPRRAAEGPEDAEVPPPQKRRRLVLCCYYCCWMVSLSYARPRPPVVRNNRGAWLFLETAWLRTVYVYPSADKRSLCVEKREGREKGAFVG